MTEKELLYLVDEHDNVIGSHFRDSESYLKNRNFRVINAFIQNSKGELWIPRRSAHKRLFPLALDVSIGGHVTYGESYEDALLKEASEEVNLDLSVLPFEEIAYLNPHEHDLSAFMKVYLIKSDDTPNYNPQDFIEYFWLTPAELIKKVADGDSSKGDLVKLIRTIWKI